MPNRRIIIFSTAYSPFVGGAEIAIKELTDRLTDFDFEMITARLDSKLPRREVVGRVVVHRIGFGSKLDKLLLPFWGAVKILKLARAEIFWPVMVSYAAGAAYIHNIIFFWRRARMVLTLQEGDSEAHLSKRHFGLIDLSWKLAISRASVLTGLSNYLLERAKRFGWSGPAFLIPNGVGDKFFNVRKRKHDGTVLITVSRLVEKNGVGDIIEALRYLPTNMTLVIAGDGELRDELERQGADLNLSERVTFLGTVENKDLPDLLAQADIFVRPSLSEGQGIAFLEAMAAGLPVIATPVGGIPDFLTDRETGLFCKPNNPRNLSERVSELADNHELRTAIVRNARALMKERYLWGKISERLRDVFLFSGYKVIIASPPAPGTSNVPTHYSDQLTKELELLGNNVRQEVFPTTLPPIIRHIVFALRIALGRADFVIVLDNFSVALSAILSGKKVIMRVGGDFLWETYVNRTGNLLLLSRFYHEANDLNLKERMVKFLTQVIYSRAYKISFSTSWQEEIVCSVYKLNKQKVSVIGNACGPKKESVQPTKKNYICIGRGVKLKNFNMFEKAFGEAKKINPELESKILKDLPQEEVWNELAACYALVVPSVSEVSPNIVMQALQYDKPVIMTRESGFARMLKDVVILVDPLDCDDIKNAVIRLADSKVYSQYEKKAREFSINRTYSDIAREFLAQSKNL